MVTKLLLSCVGFLVLMGPCWAEPDTTPKPISSTICEVVSKPNDYDGALISLTGRLEVKGFESQSYIWSKRCRGSMEIGDQGEDTNAPEIERLEKAIKTAQQLSGGGQIYVVLADIVGSFHIVRPTSSRVSYIFNIRGARNIKIITSPSIVPPFPTR